MARSSWSDLMTCSSWSDLEVAGWTYSRLGFGSAAGCEAGLRPAVTVGDSSGFAPGSGLPFLW
jgi:hypothetical protein